MEVANPKIVTRAVTESQYLTNIMLKWHLSKEIVQITTNNCMYH